ncbi:TPM domain-containing protein [Curtobacterium sp. VKM Ac-2889]|uniref:TPM domain-containing protein n=1 Tax=unclassified Curtobacterium TaxID=257496 RepID=UPI00188BB3B1|nr:MULTISPECIES: TPM domain-containing protein [unclassified Curtobacterium]MBF4598539.1 TPM domain-containing protein [Curtobacterium sp. VKM Ac-1796]MBF4611756.1 TPM domain-containing protein [Curtobacterium sp. VKM Ac-2889]
MTAALVAMLIVLAPAATAHATAPVDLGGTYVLDEADALTAPQQARVEQAVQDLYAETQTQLYVVFVPSFSDPTDHTEWGRAVLEKNQIDSGGILLSVAVTERNYDVQQTNETAISESDVQNAVDDSLLPRLKQDDWSGAAVAFADGLTQSQAPVDLTWLWILLLVVVVGLVVVVLVVRTRNKRRTAAATEAQEASLADLERTAGGALVTIDDELRTAEQEVGFASAQFGPDAAKPFADAVQAAQREVRKAFTIRQQLDDEIPDTPQQRAEWANQIIVICERAHAAIEEQTEAFDQLRSLEDGVEDAAASLAQAVAAAPASVGSAAAALDRVRARYTGRTLATVANNVDQAHQVLAFATERSNAATASIAAGDKGEAVVAVRDAQHALAQVQQLTDGALAAEQSFDEATARAEAMRIDIQGDVAAARSLRSGGPDLAAAVTRAEAVLRQGLDPKDPVAAVDALTRANTEIDQAIAAARGAEEQRQRATQALDAALRDARNRISQARDYVSLHRGGIGPTARTRLSEAQRAYDDAVELAPSNPGQALNAARAAEQYAAAAMDAANDDLGGWGGGQGGGGGGAQLGGLVTGLVLGGLLGGRGGSYGGGSFGGGGFGGGGGFSGGGGFGGGGGGGGGGFSGGGRF